MQINGEHSSPLTSHKKERIVSTEITSKGFVSVSRWDYSLHGRSRRYKNLWTQHNAVNQIIWDFFLHDNKPFEGELLRDVFLKRNNNSEMF